MSDTECPRCGASMTSGGTCPVCETPHSVSLASRSTDHDLTPASPLARWWRSGQLAVAIAAACYLGAMFLPLMGNLAMVEGSSFRTGITVRPLDLALGTFPNLRGQMSAWLLPGSALFLLEILRSRRTGSAMSAARPLVGMLAFAPLVSAAMPFLRMHRHAVSPTPGAALALVAVGAVLCAIATLRFGDGVPEAAPKRKKVEADDD